MSKAIIILTTLFFTQSITAQSNKIELLDLLKVFTADSASSGNNFYTWTFTTRNAPSVKWKSVTPKLLGQDYIKEGSSPIVVKGKNLICQSINGDSSICKWAVILSGNKVRFNMLTFIVENLQLHNQTDIIEYFFGQNKLKAKLLDKNDESAMYWSYKYLLQIPGKMPTWMEVQYMNQTGTAAQAENSNYTDLFYINFYFDEATFKSRAN